MSKHTPGPWTLTPDGLAEPENCHLVVDRRSESGMANARLMAAAPELAEALQACLALLRRLPEVYPAEQLARAALKKAGLL